MNMKVRENELESSAAFKRFQVMLRDLLSVSRDELLRREAEYQQRSALNPKRRGPKPAARTVSTRSRLLRLFRPTPGVAPLSQRERNSMQDEPCSLLADAEGSTKI